MRNTCALACVRACVCAIWRVRTKRHHICTSTNFNFYVRAYEYPSLYARPKRVHERTNVRFYLTSQIAADVCVNAALLAREHVAPDSVCVASIFLPGCLTHAQSSEVINADLACFPSIHSSELQLLGPQSHT